MRKMLSKLFKRFRRKDTVSKASSTNTTQVIHFRSSLKNHLAATKIQSAFRRYKERYNTKVSECCGINSRSMPKEYNKHNTPVERVTAHIKPETSYLSTSSEKSKSSDIHSAHQGHSPSHHAPNLQNFTLGGLLKVQATMLRCFRAMNRINPSQKTNLDLHLNPPNNENQKSDTLLKVDNWKLHLEPRSRNFTSRESSAENPDLVPVYLNVYDVSPINAYLYWLGLGVHHSGIQVDGVEYAFGPDFEGTSKIFEMEPKNFGEMKFRKEILIGWSRLQAKEVKNVINELEEEFGRKGYHIITNNCNHFSTQACLRLTANSIPPWVNRLARIIGSLYVNKLKTRHQRKT